MRFRKKQYEIGTDSQSGVVAFDSEGKRILVEDDVYGASKLEQLTDVEIGTLAGGQVLMYNAIGSKWENTDGIKAFYDCVFTLTPDPNADPETEFPNNTLITCNRTPSEIAAAFGDGKEISASLLMTDSGETEYGPIYGSLNFVAAPQLGTDVVGFIFPFMALGIVDIWIHNTDATQDWSADFSRYTLKVYRDNNDEPTNEILIDRYGGTSSIRIPQTLNGLDGVTISTAENGQVISYNGSQWVNTSLATVATSGSYNDLTGRPTIGSGILTISQNSVTIGTFSANETSDKTINIEATALYEETTYSTLKSKVDNGTLVKGQKYRITDYVTTTTQTDTSSANHAFDLVVTATDTNELDCMAQALPHSGDTYFSTAGADLTKWQVWYDINNDTTKYAWADTTNGKGVIYRLIDECGNDCPYDFKNILFTISGKTANAYTFNVYTNSTCSDHSLNGAYCYRNVIKPRYVSGIQNLNFNIFYNTSNTKNCYSNTFGDNCYQNTFKYSCYQNTFGDNCYSNTFGDNCRQNTFVDNCHSNTFGISCFQNTFGDGCHSNTFGNLYYQNTFGAGCFSNTFGINCYRNTFGITCFQNTFGDYCNSNTFGNSCHDIIFGDSSNPSVGGTYCRNNVIENGNQYIRLYQTTGTAGNNNQLQNVYIAQGVNSTTTWLDISTIARNLSYRTTVARESNGTLRIYNEDDPLTLATVATTGSYNDLSNTPTIGTGILTLQKNGTTIGTFSANEASNKTVNITVQSVGTLNTNNTSAQAVSASESLSGTVKLHKVSKTGSYVDLLDKPTIPTVGSGILSINIGTYTIGTFGANDGSARTITLPTATDAQIDALFSGFSVTVTVGTAGGGTVSASPASVNYGGSSTVTATANTNWAFLKWSDNNTDNPRTISNITENVSLTAIFEQTAFTVRALETRNLAPGDIVNPTFQGTSVPSLSTNNYPVGTVTEITVQKNGTVYLYDKEYIPSFKDIFGGLTWEHLDSQHTEPAPTQCGLLLAYEYSTDNGATWIPKVIVNGGGIDENSIQVNSDMLVRFVQTGNVYRMRANLNVSGDSDWTGGWQFNGFIGTTPEDWPLYSGNSNTFASTSFDNYPNYNIPYNGDLAVFNGMRLYIMSDFNVSAMGISEGENVCSLSGYYNNGNNSYEYPLYYTTLDGGSLRAGDNAVVVFGTGYFPELGQNVYNATVVEKPSDVEEYYLDSYFNFRSMNEPIDPENPDEPAW